MLYDARKGADLATEKRAGRNAETFGELADLYLEKRAKPRKRSWKANDNLLRNKILPKWRSRAIADITPVLGLIVLVGFQPGIEWIDVG